MTRRYTASQTDVRLTPTASLRALAPTAAVHAVTRQAAVIVACLLVFIAGGTHVAFAQTRNATIAWDPVPGDVAGYFVYVGSVPGSPASTVDVRRQTSYTIQGIEIGRGVYVSVAAYASNGAVGARSAEVFYDGRIIVEPTPAPGSGPGAGSGGGSGTGAGSTSGAQPCLAGRASCPRPALLLQASAGALTATAAAPCVPVSTGDCRLTEPIYEGEGAVAGLVPLADGALLIAERGGRVRLIDGGPSHAVRATVDLAHTGTIVHALQPAPDAATSGVTYLLLSHEGRPGLRSAQVVRLRTDRLEAPSRVVDAEIAEDAHPTLAVDPGGHIYIGLPAGAQAGTGADGVVSRVEPVKPSEPDGPFVARAYAPYPAGSVGLAVDARGQLLVLRTITSGWVLLQQPPAGESFVYGPFAGTVAALGTGPGDGLLVLSASTPALTELAVADGALTVRGRITLEDPPQAATGRLQGDLWVATQLDSNGTRYRVSVLRPIQ